MRLFPIVLLTLSSITRSYQSVCTEESKHINIIAGRPVHEQFLLYDGVSRFSINASSVRDLEGLRISANPSNQQSDPDLRIYAKKGDKCPVKGESRTFGEDYIVLDNQQLKDSVDEWIIETSCPERSSGCAYVLKIDSHSKKDYIPLECRNPNDHSVHYECQSISSSVFSGTPLLYKFHCDDKCAGLQSAFEEHEEPSKISFILKPKEPVPEISISVKKSSPPTTANDGQEYNVNTWNSITYAALPLEKGDYYISVHRLFAAEEGTEDKGLSFDLSVRIPYSLIHTKLGSSVLGGLTRGSTIQKIQCRIPFGEKFIVRTTVYNGRLSATVVPRSLLNADATVKSENGFSGWTAVIGSPGGDVIVPAEKDDPIRKKYSTGDFVVVLKSLGTSASFSTVFVKPSGKTWQRINMHESVYVRSYKETEKGKKEERSASLLFFDTTDLPETYETKINVEAMRVTGDKSPRLCLIECNKSSSPFDETCGGRIGEEEERCWNNEGPSIFSVSPTASSDNYALFLSNPKEYTYYAILAVFSEEGSAFISARLKRKDMIDYPTMFFANRATTFQLEEKSTGRYAIPIYREGKKYPPDLVSVNIEQLKGSVSVKYLETSTLDPLSIALPSLLETVSTVLCAPSAVPLSCNSKLAQGSMERPAREKKTTFLLLEVENLENSISRFKVTASFSRKNGTTDDSPVGLEILDELLYPLDGVPFETPLRPGNSNARYFIFQPPFGKIYLQMGIHFKGKTPSNCSLRLDVGQVSQSQLNSYSLFQHLPSPDSHVWPANNRISNMITIEKNDSRYVVGDPLIGSLRCVKQVKPEKVKKDKGETDGEKYRNYDSEEEMDYAKWYSDYLPSELRESEALLNDFEDIFGESYQVTILVSTQDSVILLPKGDPYKHMLHKGESALFRYAVRDIEKDLYVGMVNLNGSSKMYASWTKEKKGEDSPYLPIQADSTQELTISKGDSARPQHCKRVQEDKPCELYVLVEGKIDGMVVLVIEENEESNDDAAFSPLSAANSLSALLGANNILTLGNSVKNSLKKEEAKTYFLRGDFTEGVRVKLDAINTFVVRCMLLKEGEEKRENTPLIASRSSLSSAEKEKVFEKVFTLFSLEREVYIPPEFLHLSSSFARCNVKKNNCILQMDITRIHHPSNQSLLSSLPTPSSTSLTDELDDRNPLPLSYELLVTQKNMEVHLIENKEALVDLSDGFGQFTFSIPPPSSSSEPVQGFSLLLSVDETQCSPSLSLRWKDSSFPGLTYKWPDSSKIILLKKDEPLRWSDGDILVRVKYNSWKCRVGLAYSLLYNSNLDVLRNEGENLVDANGLLSAFPGSYRMIIGDSKDYRINIENYESAQTLDEGKNYHVVDIGAALRKRYAAIRDALRRGERTSGDLDGDVNFAVHFVAYTGMVDVYYTFGSNPRVPSRASKLLGSMEKGSSFSGKISAQEICPAFDATSDRDHCYLVFVALPSAKMLFEPSPYVRYVFTIGEFSSVSFADGIEDAPVPVSFQPAGEKWKGKISLSPPFMVVATNRAANVVVRVEVEKKNALKAIKWSHKVHPITETDFIGVQDKKVEGGEEGLIQERDSSKKAGEKTGGNEVWEILIPSHKRTSSRIYIFLMGNSDERDDVTVTVKASTSSEWKKLEDLSVPISLSLASGEEQFFFYEPSPFTNDVSLTLSTNPDPFASTLETPLGLDFVVFHCGLFSQAVQATPTTSLFWQEKPSLDNFLYDKKSYPISHNTAGISLNNEELNSSSSNSPSPSKERKLCVIRGMIRNKRSYSIHISLRAVSNFAAYPIPLLLDQPLAIETTLPAPLQVRLATSSLDSSFLDEEFLVHVDICQGEASVRYSENGDFKSSRSQFLATNLQGEITTNVMSLKSLRFLQISPSSTATPSSPAPLSAVIWVEKLADKQCLAALPSSNIQIQPASTSSSSNNTPSLSVQWYPLVKGTSNEVKKKEKCNPASKMETSLLPEGEVFYEVIYAKKQSVALKYNFNSSCGLLRAWNYGANRQLVKSYAPPFNHVAPGIVLEDLQGSSSYTVGVLGDAASVKRTFAYSPSTATTLGGVAAVDKVNREELGILRNKQKQLWQEKSGGENEISFKHIVMFLIVVGVLLGLLKFYHGRNKAELITWKKMNKKRNQTYDRMTQQHAQGTYIPPVSTRDI